MCQSRKLFTFHVVLWLLLFCPVLSSARIKMVALPERSAAVIRLDNPTATLIEEERVLTLQQGINKVDFSWKGVTIDPDSIRLTILSHPQKVVLLSVSYPPAENALVWEISSAKAYEEKVRVSYLMSNIDSLMSYKTVADKKETAMDFKSHLILRNFSGEDFDEAKILPKYGPVFSQGIKNEETKQLLLIDEENISFRKIWKWDSQKQIWDPEKSRQNVGIPVYYEISNKQSSGLGKDLLLGGKMRVYQADGQGGTILLGEDNLENLSKGEEAEIYISDSRDIVVTQRKMKEQRVNERKNVHQRTVLYDQEEKVVAKIENFKNAKAVLTMVQHIPGEWDMKKCNMKYERKDANTIQFDIDLPPQGKKELSMEYVRKNIR